MFRNIVRPYHFLRQLRLTRTKDNKSISDTAEHRYETEAKMPDGNVPVITISHTNTWHGRFRKNPPEHTETLRIEDKNNDITATLTLSSQGKDFSGATLRQGARHKKLHNLPNKPGEGQTDMIKRFLDPTSTKPLPLITNLFLDMATKKSSLPEVLENAGHTVSVVKPSGR